MTDTRLVGLGTAGVVDGGNDHAFVIDGTYGSMLATRQHTEVIVHSTLLVP